MHRDTYRLAAVYASLAEFAERQPWSYAEAVERGELHHLEALFKTGADAFYREGGKESCGPRRSPVDLRKKEYRAKQKVRKATPAALAKIDKAALEFATYDEFIKSDNKHAQAAVEFAYWPTVRAYFDAPLTVADVLREAAQFWSWEDFVENRPRHAASAGQLGVGEALQNGPGGFPGRVSRLQFDHDAGTVVTGKSINPLSIQSVILEAYKFASWEKFEQVRPRFAAAAWDHGIGEFLCNGPKGFGWRTTQLKLEHGL